MAKIDKYEVPEHLYYTTDHAWVKVQDNRIVIGITDFMQQLAGEITIHTGSPRGAKPWRREAPSAPFSRESGRVRYWCP